jgi:hypothetical protein
MALASVVAIGDFNAGCKQKGKWTAYELMCASGRINMI